MDIAGFVAEWKVVLLFFWASHPNIKQVESEL